MGKQTVSQGQLFKLLALHMFTTMIAFMLGTMVKGSGFNAPLGILLGALLGLSFAWFAYLLARRRPGEFFIDYGKEIVGRWLHYPLVLFIAFSNLMIAVINFWELQDFVTQFYLNDTPAWAIVALCGICIAYTVRFGITSVFRAAEGIFYFSLLSFLLIPFLVQENYFWYAARGFFSYFDPGEVAPSVYYTASVFGEMSFVLIIFPYISTPRRTMRSLLMTTGVATFVVLSHVIPLLLTFGPDVGANLGYPELEMLRFMRSGSFLETLDPALIALWLISLFVKLGFIIYIIVLILSRIMKVQDAKPFVFPVTLFIAIFSLALVKSSVQFATAMTEGLLTIFVLSEVIPLLYLAVDSVRRAFGGVGEAPSP